MIQLQGNIQIRHIVIDIIFNAVLPNNISSNCKSAMSVCDSVVVSLQDSKSAMLDTSGMTAARPVKFHIFGPISLNRRSWHFFPLYMLMLSINNIIGRESKHFSATVLSNCSRRLSRKLILKKNA